MGTTKKELVEDLEAKPPSAARDALIKNARAGRYHDYDSELPAPKIALVMELKQAGTVFADIALKVIEGAYDDEEPTPAQLAELREQVGPQVFDALFGEKD